MERRTEGEKKEYIRFDVSWFFSSFFFPCKHFRFFFYPTVHPSPNDETERVSRPHGRNIQRHGPYTHVKRLGVCILYWEEREVWGEGWGLLGPHRESPVGRGYLSSENRTDVPDRKDPDPLCPPIRTLPEVTEYI